MNQDNVKSFQNDVIGKKTNLLKNAKNHRSIFNQRTCPYNLCDGSGYLRSDNNGIFTVSVCQCYHDFVLRQKLRNSNIDDRYVESSMELENVRASFLKPKIKPDKPLSKKIKTKEVFETSEEYIQRVYQSKPVKSVSNFAKKWCFGAIDLLNKEPRNTSMNLMLLGEPDVGKTHLACAIAREFKKLDKTVYFTTMRSLINSVINDKDIEKRITQVDLLIIDELGKEYRNDNNWADSNIHEFFRIRYNHCLPTICTTNFYPDQIARLYDHSILSTFSTYFYLFLENDNANRVNELEKLFDQFYFVEE